MSSSMTNTEHPLAWYKQEVERLREENDRLRPLAAKVPSLKGRITVLKVCLDEAREQVVRERQKLRNRDSRIRRLRKISMRVELVEEFVAKKVKGIQKTFNFNPNLSKKQVPEDTRARNAWERLMVLRDIIIAAELDVDILYDSNGLDHGEWIRNRTGYVYAAYLNDPETGPTSVCKIGMSFSPHTRVETIQTNNHLVLELGNRYVKVGDRDRMREVERNLLYVTYRFKTRDFSRTDKGEWRRGIPRSYIRGLFKRIAAGESLDDVTPLRRDAFGEAT